MKYILVELYILDMEIDIVIERSVMYMKLIMLIIVVHLIKFV